KMLCLVGCVDDQRVVDLLGVGNQSAPVSGYDDIEVFVLKCQFVGGRQLEITKHNCHIGLVADLREGLLRSFSSIIDCESVDTSGVFELIRNAVSQAYERDTQWASEPFAGYGFDNVWSGLRPG